MDWHGIRSNKTQCQRYPLLVSVSWFLRVLTQSCSGCKTATQNGIIIHPISPCTVSTPVNFCISTGPWLLQKLCLCLTEGPEIIFHECKQNKLSKELNGETFSYLFFCDLPPSVWFALEFHTKRRKGVPKNVSSLQPISHHNASNWLAFTVALHRFATWQLSFPSLPALPSLRCLGLPPLSGIRVSAEGGIPLGPCHLVQQTHHWGLCHAQTKFMYTSCIPVVYARNQKIHVDWRWWHVQWFEQKNRSSAWDLPMFIPIAIQVHTVWVHTEAPVSLAKRTNSVWQ